MVGSLTPSSNTLVFKMLFERLNTPLHSPYYFLSNHIRQLWKKKHTKIVLLATPIHNHLPWLLQTVQAVVGVSVRFWLIQKQAVYRFKFRNNPGVIVIVCTYVLGYHSPIPPTLHAHYINALLQKFSVSMALLFMSYVKNWSISNTFCGWIWYSMP